MSLDRRELGAAAEEIAAAYLAAHGAEILERNYRRRLGELDVIAREGDTLLIIEVRTRSTSAYGGAAASVDVRKRRRIVRAAQQLLQQHRELGRLAVRFDVLVVSNVKTAQPTVDWIRHAFDASG
jgi:putative endonuclease